MSLLLIIVVGVLIVFVIGIVFSLPVLIPPLRRRLRENQQWRKVSIGLLSLLTVIFMVWFMVYVPSYGSAYLEFSRIGGLGAEPQTELIQSVTTEIWQRRITPPITREYCLTGNPNVCAIVDEMEAQDIAPSSNQDWGSYLVMWSWILFPALVTAFFAYLFTRDNRKQKQKLE